MHSLLILMSKVLAIKPDIVIMMHNINDLVVLLYEGSYFNENPYKSIIITEDVTVLRFARIFVKNFIPNIYQALLQLIDIRRWLNKVEQRDEYAHIRETKPICDKGKILAEIKMNLQLFIHICKTKNITPVLMTMESRIKENPDGVILVEFKKQRSKLTYAEFKRLFDDINDIIRKTAHENEIMVIDLAKEIPQDKEYIIDMVHLSEKGSIKAAGIISGNLVRLLSAGF